MPSEARTNQHRSFYLPPPWPGEGHEAELTGEEARHACAVMRVKVAERIRVVDGEGFEAQAEVLGVSASGVSLRLIGCRAAAAEVGLAGRIALAWIRSPSRLDWAVEKLTELGAVSVELFGGDHSVGWRLERARDKTQRWSRLARAAMKQSGRARCPEVRVHGGLAELLALLEASAGGDRLRVIYADIGGRPFAAETLGDAPAEDTVLLAGPEGGWSPGEVALLSERGAGAVELGPRRLRAETAAVILCGLAALRRQPV